MQPLEIILILLISLPFFGSLIICFFKKHKPTYSAFFTGFIAAFCLFYTLILYPTVRAGQVIGYSFTFLPEFGLKLSFRLDGLSWLFCLLITGIGLLITIYARYYLNPSDSATRLFCYFLGFMGAMLGVVLAGNLLIMFVFWELTSLFSFLLISYWTQNARAREGARMALLLTFFGGLCLFLAILLIGATVGSFDLDIVLNSKEKLLTSPYFKIILISLFIAAFTKSAQFPFHFWLPEAMTAPTPVSAYLHSATMVKAGIFLLARFWPVFSSTPEWFWILGSVGLSTLLIGAYFAMFQKDLKALLAYSTISHLGLIMTLLSLGSPLACVAAVFHIINHATFKSSLFMASGIIEHEAGTRDMRQLSGLFRAMPITGSLALVASASMAGVPLLNGFLSKEMFFSETAQTHYISWLDTVTPYIATLAGVFSVAYSVRFIHGVFFDGPALDLPKKPHEPPYAMRWPVEFLVFVCILVGILPNLTVKPILETAVISVLHGSVPTYSLALWHGWTAAVWMSLIALCGGLAFYFFTKETLKYRSLTASFIKKLNGRTIFVLFIHKLQHQIAPWTKKMISTHALQQQIRALFLLTFFLIFLTLFTYSDPFAESSLNFHYFWYEYIPNEFLNPDYILFSLLWLMGSLCAVTLAWQAKFHRLISIMLLSGTGLVTCATFLLFSAPDLALTQFLVEIVTTILLLLGLRWLPRRMASINLKRNAFFVAQRRLGDLTLAIIAGTGMAFLSYKLMNLDPIKTISQYFLQHAYSLAHGKNVVNVILVDFRAFDTLGETTVLVIVSLIIFALLRRFRPAPESVAQPLIQRIQLHMEKKLPNKNLGVTLQEYLYLPFVFVQWFFPFIIAIALFLLLNGHNNPGGGFAAGISLAIGFILQYIVSSSRWVDNHLRILPVRWMATGLFFIFFSGFIATFLGKPFLTSFFVNFDNKFLQNFPLNTVFLFDFGVLSVVLGAILLILIALAHQSIRGYHVRPLTTTSLKTILREQKEQNENQNSVPKKVPLRE